MANWRIRGNELQAKWLSALHSAKVWCWMTWCWAILGPGLCGPLKTVSMPHTAFSPVEYSAIKFAVFIFMAIPQSSLESDCRLADRKWEVQRDAEETERKGCGCSRFFCYAGVAIRMFVASFWIFPCRMFWMSDGSSMCGRDGDLVVEWRRWMELVWDLRRMGAGRGDEDYLLLVHLFSDFREFLCP